MTKPRQLLNDQFGLTDFRSRQEEIIERTIAGKHSLVIMPTGSGKSLTYQIPALILSDLTIVISPLIALMKDQVDSLRKKNIDATFINSSLQKKDREKRYGDVRNGQYKLLYVTPERFRKTEFIDILQKRKISLLAVDEAHCISEWGHDFRPDYTRINEFRKIMNNPPTIALTATATPDVQEDIIHQLGIDPEEVTIFHEGIQRPNLYLEVFDLWGEDEKLNHIRQIVTNNSGNGIIYFVLIKDLHKMSERMRKIGINHLIYHGDLVRDQRKNIQNQFMDGENNLVLATNAFGMGIDKENIRFVIHAQIPQTLEAYYQEIGRAGRDGKSAICSLLYDEQDLNIQLEFLRWNNPAAGFYDRLYRILLSDIDRVNGEGSDFLREQLTYKNRHDFRLETALGILDRYAVTEGEIEKKSLKLMGELPEKLQDQTYLDEKMHKEQEKLYQMVMYTKEQTCRKKFIHEYFGLESENTCNACDLEDEINHHPEKL
jgi:ATP-dependent DNA helicase RecQ